MFSTKLPDLTLLKMKNLRVLLLLLQPFGQSADSGLLPGECGAERPPNQQLTLRPELRSPSAREAAQGEAVLTLRLSVGLWLVWRLRRC